jgi:hypothetical protein
MNIQGLERIAGAATDDSRVQIIELLIEAIKDYPVFGLDDTDGYFEEIGAKVGRVDFSSHDVAEYIDRISASSDEESVWVGTSLTCLLQAMQLMEIQRISFGDLIPSNHVSGQPAE